MTSTQPQTNSMQKSGQMFHPSLFETPNGDTPKNNRTLKMVENDRTYRLGSESSDLVSLVSPGNFKFTVDDKQLSGSNTRHLLKGIFDESLLTFLFFSDKNVKNIQAIIKKLVFKEMGYVIDDQDYNELLIIMRSIYLEYSSHPPIIDEDTPEDAKKKIMPMYTKEVQRLNEIVVNEVVPKIVSSLQQYLDYLRDSTQQPYQRNSPQNANSAGEKQYRSITQVLLGGQL